MLNVTIRSSQTTPEYGIVYRTSKPESGTKVHGLLYPNSALLIHELTINVLFVQDYGEKSNGTESKKLLVHNLGSSSDEI